MSKDQAPLFRNRSIAPLLAFIREKFSVPFLDVYTEYDFVAYAQTILADVLPQKISLSKIYTSNYPSAHRVKITAQFGTRVITASSLEFEKDIASSKAIGEFIERTSLFLPLMLAIKNSFDAAKTTAQFRRKVLVKNLLNGWYGFVPSEHVYYGLTAKINKKKHETTSGGAGHFSYDRAVLGGWLEIIQRDAFFVHWLNTITPKKIDVSCFDPSTSLLGQKIATAKRYNLEVHFLDITSDIPVPSCACVILDKNSDDERLAVGAASGFNIEDILLRAFAEALSAITTDAVLPYTLPKDYVPFSDYSLGQAERRALFRKKPSCDKAAFLWAPNAHTTPKEMSERITGQKSLTSTSQQLRYLRTIFRDRALTNKAYNVFVFRARNVLTEKLDYHVVKIISPALYPIYLREGFADPHHPRLKEFIDAMNLSDTAKLNTYPHPFL